MKRPVISKSEAWPVRRSRDREHGVTMALVAFSLVAIMAMAALSIDVVTLYLANAEAQRSADAAALAGARILSITGMTGDPTNATTGSGTNAWQSACQLATQVATAVAQQNTVGGAVIPTAQVNVSYPNNSDKTNCSGTDAAFGVNPLVTVQVQRTNLPTFFARIWGHRGTTVSATATAEAFNSSASEAAGNGGTTLIPVRPRCVKPWLIPNTDPTPGRAGSPFIAAADGSIQNSGIEVNGSGTATGVIGESFNLTADCTETGAVSNQHCVSGLLKNNPPIEAAGSVEFVPAYVTNPAVATMSCAPSGAPYGTAIAGCDQSTVYSCGVPAATGTTQADLTINGTPDTATAVSCLINQDNGPDSLDETAYPYQIRAGFGNPLVTAGVVNSSNVITASNNIATIPVFAAPPPPGLVGTQPFVTVVGFLQVFINGTGGTTGTDVQVTVLNVIGCGDGSKNPVGLPVNGYSPVPIRLVQNYP